MGAGDLLFSDPGPEGDTGLHAPVGAVYAVNASTRILRRVLTGLARPTGIALGPGDSCFYVLEAAANRVLRATQKPAGVWTATVFHQFAGRLGPTAVVVDPARGLIYVARPEHPELGERGVISVLSPAGALLKEFEVPGPEVTGLALSPDGSRLLVAEATTNSVTSVVL